MSIIVCNSTGNKTRQKGFILPTTGDVEGSIPQEWFSSADRSSFHSFLSKLDVLVVTIPSTSKTQALVDRAAIGQLKPSSIIINVGRGETIDQEALIEALEKEGGGIAGAALDVATPEPLPDNHRLFSLGNVLVTPVCPPPLCKTSIMQS
jgi:phosphoglycerate dehydrogenase-like enzyme